MSKIVYLMGKSSSGKDTVFRELMKKDLKLNKIIPYTTRPIREGEKNGREYFFTDESGYLDLEKNGKVIEARVYQTVHGPWRYFTVNENIDLENNNYIYIGTPESFMATKNYFGSDILLPVLIDLDDGERLIRAINREKKEDHPKYEELCRRFLADQKDFADDVLERAGITRKFTNNDLTECLNEIIAYLKENGIG